MQAEKTINAFQQRLLKHIFAKCEMTKNHKK